MLEADAVGCVNCLIEKDMIKETISKTENAKGGEPYSSKAYSSKAC